MERNYVIGAPIMWIDEHGVPHHALVTQWWTGNQEIREYRSENGEPGCNLVLVSSDETKKDQYGRQIEHKTSVVHKTKQSAHGWLWCWPDEVK